MRRRTLVLAAMLLSSACVDTPLEGPLPSAPETELARAASFAAVTCTKSWTSGIGGLWADSSRWTPTGMPGPYDAVCIDAPGTYDILATQSIYVGSLVIGGDSANVTLDFDPPVINMGISADNGLTVLPGSELNVLSKGLAGLAGEFLVNFGTVDIENVCACGGDVAILLFDRIDNIGRMELDAPMSVIATQWSNGTNGVVVTSGQGVIDVLPAAALMRNWGQIVGSTKIHVDAFEWLAGSVGEVSPATSAVLVRGGPVVLSTTAGILGWLEIETDGTLDVAGGVPANVYIEIDAFDDDTVRLAGPSPTTPFVLDGQISMSTHTGDNVLDFARLVNNGTLYFNNLGTVTLGGGDLVNEGRIRNWLPALTFATPAGILRNRGQIVSFRQAALTLAPGTVFAVEGGSTDANTTLVLDGATLRGYGTMGPVEAVGASVAPSRSSGQLSVASLTLDGASELVVAASRYEHSVLDVRSAVTFGGTLRLRRAAPTVGYGGCGDAITAVRHDGIVPSGNFATFVGLNGGPASNWRVGALPDSLMLAGYDLNRDVTVIRRDSIAFEGGGEVKIIACLGATAPAADVVLTTTPVLGQLAVPPAATFDPGTWMMPMTVLVPAVDDAVIEPPQFDTLTYTLASADPLYDIAVPDTSPVAVIDDDGATDFEVVLQNAPDTVAAGAVFEIVYRVTNHGPTLSTGSAIVLSELGGGDIVFQQGFGATCYSDPTSNRQACEIAGLAAGAHQVVAIVYQATAAGTVTVPAVLYTHQSDANHANNQAATQIVVN